MTLQSYINQLRAKPDHIRQRKAFWSAFAITAVIFIFWVSSFTGWGVSTQRSVVQAVERADAPASSLVASVGSFFYDIKNLIFGPKKISYATVEVLPEK